MKKFTFLLLCLSLIFLSSCQDCEDETILIDDYLLNWLPVPTDTLISFSNQNNQTLKYTISQEDITRVELKNDGLCSTTSVQPYMSLKSATQPNFLTVWLSYETSFLEKKYQLWTIGEKNDEIKFNGTISNISNPDSIAKSESLNGIIFDDVISCDLYQNNSLHMTIYLQKDVGLIGFDYEDSLWVID